MSGTKRGPGLRQHQVSIAARRHGVTIQRVILDPRLMDRLFAAGVRGAESRQLPFMKTRPWVRHDEHYHIDFGIPCLPLRDYRSR